MELARLVAGRRISSKLYLVNLSLLQAKNNRTQRSRVQRQTDVSVTALETPRSYASAMPHTEGSPLSAKGTCKFAKQVLLYESLLLMRRRHSQLPLDRLSFPSLPQTAPGSSILLCSSDAVK